MLRIEFLNQFLNMVCENVKVGLMRWVCLIISLSDEQFIEVCD